MRRIASLSALALVPWPHAGSGAATKADIFDKEPIWTFHEIDDPTVPVHFTRDLVKAIQARGGTRLKHTEYPASLGFGHETWKPAAKDFIGAELFREKTLVVDGLGRLRPMESMERVQAVKAIEATEGMR